MTGEVKFYLVMDGFGFILGEDGNEYFFHKSEIADAKPAKGDTVYFEVGRFKTRTVAKNVQPIDGTPVDGGRNEHK
jgi:cold shock CspA family protein